MSTLMTDDSYDSYDLDILMTRDNFMVQMTNNSYVSDDTDDSDKSDNSDDWRFNAFMITQYSCTYLPKTDLNWPSCLDIEKKMLHFDIVSMTIDLNAKFERKNSLNRQFFRSFSCDYKCMAKCITSLQKTLLLRLYRYKR